jgi:V8-like Glu-specific endopeptidase
MVATHVLREASSAIRVRTLDVSTPGKAEPMPRIATLATVATLAFPLSAEAITYGEPDGDRHPNVGALVVFPGADNLLVCSGTLIAPTVFLTASHCTAFLEELGLPVGVTFEPAADTGAAAIPGTVHTNPDFQSVPGIASGKKDPADVAVVTLDVAPVGITPAALPPPGLLDTLGPRGLRGQRFTSVGYGATERVKVGPGAPQFGSVGTRMVSNGSFSALTRSYLQLSQNPSTGDGGTCFGDSGGPNFLGTSNVIAGVTVTGDAVCRASNATLRTDTPAARAFLDAFVALPD